MKDKSSKSQRLMKQSTLFEYSSPPKAGPSSKTEPGPSKSKPKTKQATTPRKSTQTKFPITPRSSKKQPTESFNLSDSDDSEEGISHIKLQKKKSTAGSSSSTESSSSDKSSESDAAPRPTQARRLEKLAAFVDDEEEDEVHDVPKQFSTRSSKHRKLKTRRRSEEESSGEDVAPKRRRLTRSRKTPVAGGAESVDEDVDDLDQEYVLEARLRERGKQSEFQRNLEKLRKRKLKQKVSTSEEEDDESETVETPFKGAKQTHGSNGSLFGSNGEDESDEESESDFIVEDDGRVELPAQFSMETHQDLQHQFKKIYQFFVHIAVQDAGARRTFMEDNLKNQEYFSVPLQITRRKLDGLRDSLVASSVWRPEFRKALERYPIFNLVQLDFAVNGCDACHLGSRISTLSGRLDGVPYDRMGFHPLKVEKKRRRKDGKKKTKSNPDYDSDSSVDGQSVKKVFDLGRFCARRTQVYHDFSHWEYELFCGIDQEIQDIRAQRTKKTKKQFYRVAFAGGKQPPEDLSDADELTDWLDERGLIEREWQRIRLIMDSARKLEMDGKKGGADMDTS